MTAVTSRFCPSPTGLMHLGNARTALFNALFAIQQKGTFLLRMEDTDRARSTLESAEQLMDDLLWLGLDWQEGPDAEADNGPYWQSQRQPIYDRYYTLLESSGRAYECFCTEQELSVMRRVQLSSGKPPRYAGTCRHLTKEEIARRKAAGEQPVLRFRVPDNETVEFTDLVRGLQRFATQDLGDFIIRRADGTSPFMFCNAIDDALMGVTHALRGEDHLTNTPRQILIYQALGLRAPDYGHISLIVGADHSPLSKRNGSRSIKELKEQGFLPAAVQNYLARLGHYYADSRFMTLYELAEGFKLSALGSAPAHYDEQQLLYWQKEAVMALDSVEFWQWLPRDPRRKIPLAKRDAFVALLQSNILFPEDSLEWIDIFSSNTWSVPTPLLETLSKSPRGFFSYSAECLTEECTLAPVKTGLMTKFSVKGKELFLPLRLALTGHEHGPELEGILKLLGPDECRRRWMALETQCANL